MMNKKQQQQAVEKEEKEEKKEKEEKQEEGLLKENQEAVSEQPEQEEEKKEEEDLKIQYMRLAADFQNFKKRTEKEKADIYAYANEKIALDLLDVIDNFERALLHQEESKDEKMKEGIHMIFKQLKGVLEKNKVEEISALGEDFDPNFHNAVMTEASEEYESGKISAVLQKGYLLNSKVIRAAIVKVAE